MPERDPCGRIVTNGLLFDGRFARTDALCVVADPPEERLDQVKVWIPLNAAAAALSRGFPGLPRRQPLAADIRSGNGSSWLLAGGVLLCDQQGRIAVGLRDGNAADPFAYTNIGAGHCDRNFGRHCTQELASECILCLQSKRGWHQVDWGPGTVDIRDLHRPCIRSAQLAVAAEIRGYLALPVSQSDTTGIPQQELVVNWYAGSRQRIILQERLQGVCCIDRASHTVEFRQVRQLRLERYRGRFLAFVEGTGHGEWMEQQVLRALATAQHRSGKRLLTPFLMHLALHWPLRVRQDQRPA